jgi:hypothetical protein
MKNEKLSRSRGGQSHGSNMSIVVSRVEVDLVGMKIAVKDVARSCCQMKNILGCDRSKSRIGNWEFSTSNIKLARRVDSDKRGRKLKLGARCKIYPAVHAKIAEQHFHEVPSAAAYRALAKNFYAYGADGVSVYNFHYSWRADIGAEKDWPSVMQYLADLREPGSVERGSRQYLL